jgi:hypothetical protein
LSRACNKKTPYTPYTPYTPHHITLTWAIQLLHVTPIPYDALKLSWNVNECTPQARGVHFAAKEARSRRGDCLTTTAKAGRVTPGKRGIETHDSTFVASTVTRIRYVVNAHRSVGHHEQCPRARMSNIPISVYHFPGRVLTLCPQLCMGIQPGARFPARSIDAFPATLYGHFTQAIYQIRPITLRW